MFDELDKYKLSDHFFLQARDSLIEVCNAPTDKSGVFIVYALKNGGIELMYIGHSGEMLPGGSMFINKEGLGGIKEEIVNGHQFGEPPAHNSWINKIKKEGIEALDIYWYVTHNKKYSDCPRVLENELLQKHIYIYGRVPEWNKAL